MFGLQKVSTYCLSNRVVPKCAGIGVFEPEGNAQIVAATITNKVIIYDSEISLNINEKILALSLAIFDATYDIIVIGTSNGVLAHDVYRNIDLFRRELPDGVSCIEVSKFGSHGQIVMCGSNCALWGFDSHGKDVFWTVTGARVSALCFTDIDNDGSFEVIVGTDNNDIRVFKDDLLLYELNETDEISCLCNLGKGRFAYGLSNGTLGVYEGETRIWRIKTKNQPIALTAFPDATSLACAWSGGKIDIRQIEDGEARCKEAQQGEVANLFVSGEVLTLITVDGFAFVFVGAEAGTGLLHTYNTPLGAKLLFEKSQVHGYKISFDQNDFEENGSVTQELDLQRRNLLAELQSYEQNRNDLSVTSIATKERKITTDTTVEANLRVNCQIVPPSVELELSISNDAVIRAVVIFGEGIFDGESYIVHPTSNFSQKLSMYLRPERDVAVLLLIKAFTGYPESKQLHIFELTRLLPRFSMYALSTENDPKPSGYATFQISEKPIRLTMWINENFLLTEELKCENDSKFAANFYSIRTRKIIFIEMDVDGTITIRSDDMEIVGNIIQSIAEYFNINTLSTRASFPSEMKALDNLTANLNEMYSLQDQLSASMAERMSMVKELLVRAEDARIIEQTNIMKKYYVKLQMTNQAMIAEHKVRCNNYDQLLDTLRQLNKTIEKGARLRVGDPARKVISLCREAISNEHFDMLPKIIFFGV